MKKFKRYSKMNESIYRRELLELYKHPHNFGNLKNPDIEYTLNNPLCGDEITVKLKIKNKKVEEINFIGIGCVISIAQTSLLTDKVKGMNIDEIKKISADSVLSMLKTKINPARIKCALLSLETIKGAISKNEHLKDK